MKNTVVNKIIPSLILITSVVSLSGCFARLLTMRGAGMTAVRGVAVEGLEVRTLASGITEVRVAGSAARAVRMGITAEEVSIFSRSTAEIQAGRLVAADEIAFNSAIGRIKLVRTPGRNPRLFVKNASEPFAEVLPNEGRIKLFNNNTISLHNNIFSIENDIVYVRNNSLVAADVVTTLRKGDMVIKLAEKNGWYEIRLVQEGTELSGFIEAAFLAPLLILSADSEDEEKVAMSPSESISGEVKQRWKHYWGTIDSRQVTAQDALNILYADFGSNEYSRQISFTYDDWPTGVNTFLKMEYANIPILSGRDFKDTNLSIIGFTKAGELLEYLNVVGESVKLNNPGDWGPKNYGLWHEVKTLDGQYGWVFTKPFDQDYPSGYKVEKIIPIVPTPEIQQSGGEKDKEKKIAGKPSNFSVKILLIILGVVLFLILLSAFKRSR